MKSVIYILITILSIGCGENLNTKHYRPTHETKERERLSNKVMRSAAHQLKTGKNLTYIGSGAQASKDIQMLAMSFSYYNNINIEQGRELLIASVDMLINAVNAEKEIYPHLSNIPFDPGNIEIRIFLKNQDGRTPEPGEISVISALRGHFEYQTKSKDSRCLITLHEESYNEALKQNGNRL